MHYVKHFEQRVFVFAVRFNCMQSRIICDMKYHNHNVDVVKHSKSVFGDSHKYDVPPP